MLPVYDALDAFVMTSHAETIGTVTLEAMARRVPVVGSLAGGTVGTCWTKGRGIGFESLNDRKTSQRAVHDVLDMDDRRNSRDVRAWP